MIEKALLVTLVAVAVLFGASRLGDELRRPLCEVSAAFDGGTCRSAP